MTREQHNFFAEQISEDKNLKPRLTSWRSKLIAKIFVFNLITFLPVFANYALFDGEVLFYDMKYKGITSAKAVLRSTLMQEPEKIFHISAEVNTKSVFNWIFAIDNEYHSFVDGETGTLLKVSKNVNQRNIKQKLEIIYNWSDLQATEASGTCWTLPAPAFDLFSMIYKIRSMNPKVGQDIELIVDIEGQIWNACGHVENGRVPQGQHSEQEARKIVLTFSPHGPLRGRFWKTDILNNRISRDGAQLHLYFAPTPQSIPLFIKFGQGSESAEMMLAKVQRKK